MIWKPRRILERGEAMQSTGKIKVLFILGFGPIVRDTAESRKLYSDSLGIRFKEESGEYLHTEGSKAPKVLHSGRCLRPLSHVLAKTLGPTIFRFPKPGLSLMWTTSRRQQPTSNRGDIECSSKTRKSRGAKRSVASSHRRDCWSALPLLRRCEERKRKSPDSP